MAFDQNNDVFCCQEKLYNKLISGHGGIKSSYFDCSMLSAWNALRPFLSARSGEGLPKYRMLLNR